MGKERGLLSSPKVRDRVCGPGREPAMGKRLSPLPQSSSFPGLVTLPDLPATATHPRPGAARPSLDRGWSVAVARAVDRCHCSCAVPFQSSSATPGTQIFPENSFESPPGLQACLFRSHQGESELRLSPAR